MMIMPLIKMENNDGAHFFIKFIQADNKLTLFSSPLFAYLIEEKFHLFSVKDKPISWFICVIVSSHTFFYWRVWQQFSLFFMLVVSSPLRDVQCVLEENDDAYKTQWQTNIDTDRIILLYSLVVPGERRNYGGNRIVRGKKCYRKKHIQTGFTEVSTS